jgi:hypothetical protein
VSNGNWNNWQANEGVLIADSRIDEGGKNYLLTTRSFSNFELEFDYQLAPNTVSGLTFWATRDDAPWNLEINNGSDLTGRIRLLWPNLQNENFFAPGATTPIDLRPEGFWNRMTVEVKANALKIFVNGAQVFEKNPTQLSASSRVPASMKRRSGSIGFRNLDGMAMFRGIIIKELSNEALTKPETGKPIAQDLFRRGSVWDGENSQGGLKVTQRQGETFAAEFWRGNDKQRIKGTILDGKITWYARDVEVLQGDIGHGTWGRIYDDEVSIEWRDKILPDPRVTYILRLRNK